MGDLVIIGNDRFGEERRMRDNMQMVLREIYLRDLLLFDRQYTSRDTGEKTDSSYP